MKDLRSGAGVPFRNGRRESGQNKANGVTSVTPFVRKKTEKGIIVKGLQLNPFGTVFLPEAAF